MLKILVMCNTEKRRDNGSVEYNLCYIMCVNECRVIRCFSRVIRWISGMCTDVQYRILDFKPIGDIKNIVIDVSFVRIHHESKICHWYSSTRDFNFEWKQNLISIFNWTQVAICWLWLERPARSLEGVCQSLRKRDWLFWPEMYLGFTCTL